MSVVFAERDAPVQAAARDVLHRLTHADHVRLNAHPLLRDITRPGYPQGDYIKVLLAYHQAYQLIEAEIRETLASHDRLYDYAGRWKLGWLECDLACFNVDPVERCGVPRRWTSPAAIFGVMYVVEGSSLGGRFIASCLERTLALNAANGARFFHCYGSETDARWRDFVAALNARLTDVESRREAANAAVEVFNLVESQLDEQWGRYLP